MDSVVTTPVAETPVVADAAKESPAADPKATPISADSPVAGTAAAATATKPDDKPAPVAEAEKPGRRAWAALADKEAALVEQKRTFSEERKAWDAERTAQAADLKTLNDLREAIKGGSRMKALEILGIDLDAIQDEFLASQREPTAQELAERAAQKIIDERERTAEQKRLDAQKQANEAANVEYTNRVAAWQDTAETEFKAHAADFDLCVAHDVTAEDVWNRALKEHGKTGKLCTPIEALKLMEADYTAKLGRSKKFKPAAVEAKPEAAKDKQKPQARDSTPRTLTSKGAGEVPLRPRSRAPEAKPDALERAREAMRELNVS